MSSSSSCPTSANRVAALIAGRAPEPKWVKTSKQRSTHNNYITLPVLFMMLSNHYPVTFANRAVIPAIVTCVVIAGALVRYFYNRLARRRRHGRPRGGRGRRRPSRSGRRSGSRWRPRPACGRTRPRAGARADACGGLDLPQAPQAVVDVVRRAASCATRPSRLGGDRRSAEGRHARHAGAYRALRAGDPHAGGADPRHAAQQPHRNHAGRAPRARALARPSGPPTPDDSRAFRRRPRSQGAPDGAARRVRRVHRRARPA